MNTSFPDPSFLPACGPHSATPETSRWRPPANLAPSDLPANVASPPTGRRCRGGALENWRSPYLGLRDIPHGLDDFELTTFFSYSADDRRCIAERRQPTHRLAMALHIGFIRMTGRTPDAFERVPKKLWAHNAEQIDEDPPEIATLRSLYSERPRTLADHQKLAYKALGFQQMTEHQRRYVVRWLRETLAGRAGATGLLPELKRWFLRTANSRASSRRRPGTARRNCSTP